MTRLLSHLKSSGPARGRDSLESIILSDDKEIIEWKKSQTINPPTNPSTRLQEKKKKIKNNHDKLCESHISRLIIHYPLP